jgi:hypothetical protein
VLGFAVRRLGLPLTYGAALNLFRNPIVGRFCTTSARTRPTQTRSTLQQIKTCAAVALEFRADAVFPGGRASGAIERAQEGSARLLDRGYRNNLIRRRPAPDVYIVRAVSYPLVLSLHAIEDGWPNRKSLHHRRR